MKGDLLNGSSHLPEGQDALGRSLRAQHSLKSFRGREAGCNRGKTQSRKGDCGRDLRQGA